jgi:hypothetical protein
LTFRRDQDCLPETPTHRVGGSETGDQYDARTKDKIELEMNPSDPAKS